MSARSQRPGCRLEPNLTKVQAINCGRSVIKEPGLDNLVSQAVAAGRLRVTQKGTQLVPWGDVSLICVGTPSAPDGSPVLAHEIGCILRQSLDETLDGCQAVIVTQRRPEFSAAVQALPSDVAVLDLVRPRKSLQSRENYKGIV